MVGAIVPAMLGYGLPKFGLREKLEPLEKLLTDWLEQNKQTEKQL